MGLPSETERHGTASEVMPLLIISLVKESFIVGKVCKLQQSPQPGSLHRDAKFLSACFNSSLLNALLRQVSAGYAACYLSFTSFCPNGATFVGTIVAIPPSCLLESSPDGLTIPTLFPTA